MRICYIVHRPNLNGASRSLLDLLDGLDRTRFEPVVLVNSRGPLLDELRQRNIPYFFAPLIPSVNADNPVLDFIKRILNSGPFYRLFLAGIKHRLRQIDPDIVHNNCMLSTIGMKAAKDLGIPYICHYRELLWEGHHRKLIRVKHDRKLMEDATVGISISQNVKEAYVPYAGDRIVVIPDGIHVEHYDLPAHDILSGDTITLLLAGRIHPNKSQLDAVKAVQRAREQTGKDLRLVMLGSVGDEPYANKLHNYVSKNHLNFVSIEAFTKDLRDLRQHCDIGLTCSMSEGLGRVTIENMLSSLLVIASRSGATPEVVDDGKTGVLYEYGNIEDFSNKIIEAVQSPERGRQIARAGHDYAVKAFDHRAYAQKIQSVYESIGGAL